MKIISFIALALLLTWISTSVYAIFDEEEIGAIRGVASVWDDQWRTSAHVDRTKAVIDGIIARMDWKVQNVESQAKPYLDALQAKQKALQDAINARQPEATLQRLYQEVQAEQQKHGQTLQAMSMEVATLNQQKNWLEGIQYYVQQLESCQLRTQVLECKEKTGSPVVPADILEERRSFNVMLQNTGVSDITPENFENTLENLDSSQLLGKQKELCGKRSEVVSKHFDKTIETQEAQERELERLRQQQEQTRHGL